MTFVRTVLGILTRDNEPVRRDVLLAVALTVAGELEVLLMPGDGSRLVSALALPIATLPIAWRRRFALLPLVAVAAALFGQAPLDGFLVGQSVTPLVALMLALYSAGRHVAGARGFAAAVVLMTIVVATRAGFDPAVERVGDVILTFVAVSVALLVGRWVRGQVLLQRELGETAQRIERERERDTRQAAEDERMRIAADLHAAVAGSLGVIVRRAQELPPRLAAADHAAARELFTSIAAGAREALADVRRVLGVLRHEGQAAPLAPPGAGAGAAAAADPGAALAAPPAVLSARPEATAVKAPTGDVDGVATAGAATTSSAAATAAPRRAWSRPFAGRGEHWLDYALVAALLTGAALELALTAPADTQPLAALTAAAIVTPLLWRRRRPELVALAVFAAVFVQSAALQLDAFPACDIISLICAAYAIGAYADRRAAIAGLVLFALGAVAHAALFYPDGILPALLGGAVVPWIVGRTVHSHRRLTDELQHNAARSEHAREQQARAAATAERARVARELHDAVAHNISVIAIQAAGADGIVERDPRRAAQCAELIDAVAREALAELGRLVGASRGAAAPHPSLARVDGLANRTREGGLPVDVRVVGEPTALPAGVDLAAFRIVQEALANASKHAGGARAWVVVRYEARAVEVEIGDDGRGPKDSAPSSGGFGHGLIGMHERVALYGGTLDAGRRPDGGFMVRARLPIGRS